MPDRMQPRGPQGSVATPTGSGSAGPMASPLVPIILIVVMLASVGALVAIRGNGTEPSTTYSTDTPHVTVVPWPGTQRPRDLVNDLQNLADVYGRIPGVTGSSIHVWGRTFEIDTGIILPGEAREVGDAVCRGLGASPRSGELRSQGWAVEVKGAAGTTIYRCFV